MWQEIVSGFTSLFDGLGYIPMIALIAGVILLCVELFAPGFGIFGIPGSVFAIGGITARMVMGGTLMQLVIMLTVSVAVLIVAFILVLILAKFGFLNFGIIQNKTAVPTNYSKPSREHAKLLGKVGFATTAFRPVGSFTYKDKVYEAVSTGEYIAKNSKVKVVEVDGDQIKVKKI